MCYDAEYIIRKQLKEALKRGAKKEKLERLWTTLISHEQKSGEPNHHSNLEDEDDSTSIGNYYHVSGYSRPWALIMTDLHQPNYELARWGFIPSWVRDSKDIFDYKKPSNFILNAQSEGMFDSKVFRNAARYGRCVIQINAYYEHHDQNGKKYPFRITHEKGSMWIAGIYEKYQIKDKTTGKKEEENGFALLTCTANEILSRIHNNPKMVSRTGHRMLTILEEDQLESYLHHYPENNDPAHLKLFEQEIRELCGPYDASKLNYHPVRNLKKRKEMPYIGNVPEIREYYEWSDLDLRSIFAA